MVFRTLDPRTAYEQALHIMHTASDIQAAMALLSWDQETYMPPEASHARAEQLATLSGIAHATVTSPTAIQIAEYFHEMLPKLNGELSQLETGIVRVFVREVLRATRLPEEFVQRKSRITALAQEAWKLARAESSFDLFRDHLQSVLEIMIEEAHYRGYTEHPYDALLDLYEPGMTVSMLSPMFERLQAATAEILRYVADATHRPDDKILRGYYPADKQLALSKQVIEAMGFNFTAGRVDLSAHPFCTSFATRDVRLTTRINEHDLRSCLFGLIHEAGHGLYEQGIRVEFERTFAREGASMGIHESQSLFWENIIARSEEFWHWALPLLRGTFPSLFETATPEQIYAAINRVEPSLIRIEADEVTYNLHIILRFRIEKELFEGQIGVDEVPDRWNRLMQDLLGIEVPDDAQGCLQDIHWSFGGFGYFPSYALGKLYAAMFRTALLQAMPDAPEYVRRGQFAPIRRWLHENIHQWGRTMEPAELVQHVTGRSLTEQDFVEYAWAKVRRVYGG